MGGGGSIFSPSTVYQNRPSIFPRCTIDGPIDGLSMDPRSTLDRLSMDPRFTLDRHSIKLFYRGSIGIDTSVDDRCRFESKTSLPSIVDDIVTISKRCRYESTIIIDSSKRYRYDLVSVSCASREMFFFYLFSYSCLSIFLKYLNYTHNNYGDVPPRAYIFGI